VCPCLPCQSALHCIRRYRPLSFFAALDSTPARGLTVWSLAQGQRLVLTMDDLSQSLKEYGITVKKVCAEPLTQTCVVLACSVLTLARHTHTARILCGSECRSCGRYAFRVHLVGRHIGVGSRQKEEANQVKCLSGVSLLRPRCTAKTKTKKFRAQFPRNIYLT
jgi:hypothetical protein